MSNKKKSRLKPKTNSKSKSNHVPKWAKKLNLTPKWMKPRKCAYRNCKVIFTPTIQWHKFHTVACADSERHYQYRERRDGYKPYKPRTKRSPPPMSGAENRIPHRVRELVESGIVHPRSLEK